MLSPVAKEVLHVHMNHWVRAGDQQGLVLLLILIYTKKNNKTQHSSPVFPSHDGTPIPCKPPFDNIFKNPNHFAILIKILLQKLFKETKFEYSWPLSSRIWPMWNIFQLLIFQEGWFDEYAIKLKIKTKPYCSPILPNSSLNWQFFVVSELWWINLSLKIMSRRQFELKVKLI